MTGIDRDERSIDLARAHPQAGDIAYLHGDFLDAPIEPASVDLVTSVASLHQMDAEAALRRICEVLRPGGVLVVIGLARDRSLTDVCLAVPAAVASWVRRAAAAWSRGGAAVPATEYQSPLIWPPALTYRQARRLAERVLPGVRYRRRLYWRYSLVWTRP